MTRTQRRDQAGRWAEQGRTDPGPGLLSPNPARPHVLLPRSTPSEALTFLAGLTVGQQVLLTSEGQASVFTVEDELGPAGAPAGTQRVTFRSAAGTRSLRRTITVAEITAGFSPTITVEAEWQRCGRLAREARADASRAREGKPVTFRPAIGNHRLREAI